MLCWNFWKKIFLTIIIIRVACKTQKIVRVFWSNLKYLNRFWVQKRTLKIKKDLKIPYVSHFICLLIIICTLNAKIQKKKKMYACKAAVGGPFLEMALHYHRVYQISSLEANLSLEGLKQPCRQTQPKNNNLAWFLLTMIKNNSKHTLIFPETPVTSTLSDVAEVEPVYIVSPYLVLVCWLLILSILLALPIYIFLSLNNLKLFFKTS